MLPDIRELEEIVCRAAQVQVLPRFEKVGHEIKADGSLLTEADLATDEQIKRALDARWPQIGFLSEEMEREAQEELLAHTDRPLWCLDPVDGTSNFVAGIPYFAVSLALIQRGEVVMAITYDPIRSECFSAQKGKGARLNGKPLTTPSVAIALERAVALADFKRLPAELRARLANDPPFASQRNFGSCALEWCWMAAGRGHVYLHGGMKLWDFAAGSLILDEAGGHSCTLEGESVFKASMTPRSVVASPHADLFTAWKKWLMGDAD